MYSASTSHETHFSHFTFIYKSLQNPTLFLHTLDCRPPPFHHYSKPLFHLLSQPLKLAYPLLHLSALYRFHYTTPITTTPSISPFDYHCTSSLYQTQFACFQPSQHLQTPSSPSETPPHTLQPRPWFSTATPASPSLPPVSSQNRPLSPHTSAIIVLVLFWLILAPSCAFCFTEILSSRISPDSYCLSPALTVLCYIALRVFV